jgi:hypothetical protein
VERYRHATHPVDVKDRNCLAHCRKILAIAGDDDQIARRIGAQMEPWRLIGSSKPFISSAAIYRSSITCTWMPGPPGPFLPTLMAGVDESVPYWNNLVRAAVANDAAPFTECGSKISTSASRLIGLDV